MGLRVVFFDTSKNQFRVFKEDPNSLYSSRDDVLYVQNAQMLTNEQFDIFLNGWDRKHASPLLDDWFPPMLLFHGTQDIAVAFSQS